jgi:hypothetical protein
VTANFRLASVLRLRRILRDEAEVRAAQAHRTASLAADLAALRLTEARNGTYLGGDAALFRASVTAQGQRAETARNAEHAAVDARAAHRARIDELTRAAMAVSALERLEQRAIDAARAEELRREAREVDDLVTARFAKAHEAGR